MSLMNKKGKWNRETCFDDATKYMSKSEFSKNSKTSYQKAWDFGWLVDYGWFIRPKDKQIKWTMEKCFDEAKKYSSRIEFANGNPTAYQISTRKGWIDNYTWFKPPHSWKKR